jgi:hypothetical protein
LTVARSPISQMWVPASAAGPRAWARAGRHRSGSANQKLVQKGRRSRRARWAASMSSYLVRIAGLSNVEVVLGAEVIGLDGRTVSLTRSAGGTASLERKCDSQSDICSCS